MSEDTSAPEPTTVEPKFWAPRIGVVHELDLSLKFGCFELLSFHGPA